MTHLTSPMTAPAEGTAERCKPARDGFADKFESVSELGGWVRVAMLGLFAPEILRDTLNDERVSTGASAPRPAHGDCPAARL